MRVPVLVGFLGLGMLLGSEGLGGIEFDDPDLARTVGIVSLVAILFEGGLTTSWRAIRPVAVPAAVLSTAGVTITAVATGAAAYVLFDLPLTAALLLGAIVGSTDAAAVFATLRFSTMRRRLARLLEAESGANDPMAVALTIGLIEWLSSPAYGMGDLALLLLRQLGIGLALGLALGVLAARGARRFPGDLGAFVPVASVATAALAYGITDAAGGSGFLAVYLVGLALGGAKTVHRRTVVSFHQGTAFIAQVSLFVVLGLLVFPSHLGPVTPSGLALAAVLTFIARPLAVWICTAFQGFSRRERTLLGWAGLRGAVPIVLATFALSADVAESDTLFNAVFFVVLVSAVLQGLTLEPLAARLGLTSAARPRFQAPVEVAAIEALGADLVEYTVEAADSACGRPLRDLGLPGDAVVAVIVREGQAIPPRGSTVIAPGDHLFVIGRGASQEAVERVFGAGASGS